MTTKVTVSASGACYPARLVHVRGGEELVNKLIPGGESAEVWCTGEDTVTVTEEYFAGGYKPETPEA